MSSLANRHVVGSVNPMGEVTDRFKQTGIVNKESIPSTFDANRSPIRQMFTENRILMLHCHQTRRFRAEISKQTHTHLTVTSYPSDRQNSKIILEKHPQ